MTTHSLRLTVSLLLMPAMLLTLVGCRSGDSSTRPRTPAPVMTLDLRGLSTDERFTAVCLQGLANRDAMRVYLDTGKTVRWMQWGKWGGPTPPPGPDGSDHSICDFWMNELSSRGLCAFEKTTLPQLVAQLAGQVKGVILYEKVGDDLCIAATMAGLRDAVPMTPALHERLTREAGVALPVIFDVRTLYAGYTPDVERRLEAHRWLIANLLPQCAKSGALSRDRTYGLDEHDTLIDIDLAVQNRWVTFDLSYLSPQTAESSSKPHPKYGLDMPDTALLVQILESLEPFAPVYGWGRPGERSLVKRTSMHSRTFVCTGTANSSFYHHMPMLTKSLVQPPRDLSKLQLENRIYIVFMVNEGDTLKYMASLANGGSWVQPQRGSLPINWGMNPQLYEQFPGLVSYYLATAGPQDYFFSATSGWGYVHPDSLPSESLMPYAALVKRGGELGGLQFFDPWWTESLRKNNTLYPFLAATGMKGMTQWKGYQRVDFAPDGSPVIYGNHYYTLKDPAAFTQTMLTQAQSIQSPWFVVVYGGEPRHFAEVAANLPTDRFKVVLLDEFFAAAKLARGSVEGRVFEPAKPEKKAVAPGDIVAPTN
jgi:hypothetical protein